MKPEGCSTIWKPLYISPCQSAHFTLPWHPRFRIIFLFPNARTLSELELGHYLIAHRGMTPPPLPPWKKECRIHNPCVSFCCNLGWTIFNNSASIVMPPSYSSWFLIHSPVFYQYLPLLQTPWTLIRFSNSRKRIGCFLPFTASEMPETLDSVTIMFKIDK